MSADAARANAILLRALGRSVASNRAFMAFPSAELVAFVVVDRPFVRLSVQPYVSTLECVVCMYLRLGSFTEQNVYSTRMVIHCCYCYRMAEAHLNNRANETAHTHTHTPPPALDIYRRIDLFRRSSTQHFPFLLTSDACVIFATNWVHPKNTNPMQ